MAKLKDMKRPDGKEADLRFFVNEDTGNRWNARIEFRELSPPGLPGLGPIAAPQEYAVVVSVAPVDDVGKVRRDAEERPMIGQSHSHTFTGFELQDPQFSPAARVSEILHELVDAEEVKRAKVSDLQGFIAKWQGGSALAPSLPPPVPKPASSGGR